MKKLLALLLLGLVSISASAQVTRYNYTSEPIGSVSSGTAYTLGGVITGYLETTGPLPANQTDIDILPQIQDFSFNDSANTYTPSNGLLWQVLPSSPAIIVTTDGNGNIVNWDFYVYSPGLPHANGDRLSRAWLSGTTDRDRLLDNFECNGNPAPGTPCVDVLLNGASQASTPSRGSWNVTKPIPPIPPIPPTPIEPASIPTMPVGGLLLLSLLLCVLVGRAVHRACFTPEHR